MNKSISRKTKENLFRKAFPSFLFVMDAAQTDGNGIVLEAAAAISEGLDEEDLMPAYMTLMPMCSSASEAYMECFTELNIADEFEKWGGKEKAVDDALYTICMGILELYRHMKAEEDDQRNFPFSDEYDPDESDEEKDGTGLPFMQFGFLDGEDPDNDFITTLRRSSSKHNK